MTLQLKHHLATCAAGGGCLCSDVVRNLAKNENTQMTSSRAETSPVGPPRRVKLDFDIPDPQNPVFLDFLAKIGARPFGPRREGRASKLARAAT